MVNKDVYISGVLRRLTVLAPMKACPRKHKYSRCFLTYTSSSVLMKLYLFSSSVMHGYFRYNIASYYTKDEMM